MGGNSVLSNGFKIQYGRKEVSANAETEITMPTSFIPLQHI